MPGEKTEKATPKRKKDERKKGNIFQSKEIVIVASMVILFYSLRFLGPYIIGELENSMTYFIGLAATMDQLSPADITPLLIRGIISFCIAALPMLLIACFAAFLFTAAQTRMLVSFKSMKPKASRISFLKGLKRMFSMRGFIELLKAILKIVVLGVIIYNRLKDEIPLLPRLMDMDIKQAMALTGSVVLSIAQTAAIFFAFLAAADLLYQWWDYEKNLRMSKQEIKDEYKQNEGDPQVKGKIKERQQAMSRRRMMQQVPSADVVIRNPTHFAVAIRYQAEKNSAPVVVAKGADYLALRIVAIAEEHKVMTIENKPLARGLYESVDLDREIPEKFYQPVAEVLAYVYSLTDKDKLRAAAAKS